MNLGEQNLLTEFNLVAAYDSIDSVVNYDPIEFAPLPSL
jgi:hypothetical protein